MEKKALGRGLEALLPESGWKGASAPGEVQNLPLDQILPNRYQPRRKFDDSDLAQLAESVKQNGLLQPILVRRKGDGFYELIAGERRVRAARLAGLTTLPAIVRNSSDEQAIELALVENLQREDLNPMEAARAYHRLAHEFGLTQETIARRVGKDRSSIANIARLVNLPHEIQELVEAGMLTTGHAKVLLGSNQSEAQLRLARRIVEGQLSVREAEKMAASEPGTERPKQRARRPNVFAALQERLQKHLGTRVTISKGRRGGKIVVYYFAPTDLDRLVEMILR